MAMGSGAGQRLAGGVPGSLRWAAMIPGPC